MKRKILVVFAVLILFRVSLFSLLLRAAQASSGIVFERAYGGVNWDRGSSVQQTSDKGYIIVGTTESFGAGESDVYLIKSKVLQSKLVTVWGKIKTTKLFQNYPNPGNPETWIPFKLADPSNVILSIYDIHGQLVRKIELGKIPTGIYIAKDKASHWNGRNDVGEKVASGLYFYTLQANDYSATKRMLILK